MATVTTEQGEEGRAFLQRRVALFAKVMLGINLVGDFAHVAFSGSHGLLKPWFGFVLLATGFVLAAWLLCRRGKRSIRFVRVVEAAALIGTAISVGFMGRFKLPGVATQVIGEVAAPGDLHYGHVLGIVVNYFALGVIIGLTLMVVLRAALVPSRVLRTVVVTAATGLVAGAIMAGGAVPFEGDLPLRAHTPDRFVVMTAVNFAIWWTFTTITCVVISQVVHGLRRDVRVARRLGQYTLETKLGEGGMGEVYRASHAMMRRPTAVKLLSAEKSDESQLARFEREVQLTARLTHPNTVTIFDYGRTPGGTFYYAMELLDGATLEEIVKVDGAQPPARVIKLLAEVAGALEEAHGIDLIHRDIKPANIIVCSQGGRADVAKLLDFGLVKEVSARDDLGITNANSITGTPLYMAPESLTSPGDVDARSDLYALGAVGYYLLVGEHVFTGASMVEVCGHHLHTEPVAPSERRGEPVPEDLEKLLLACLAKAPGARPQSAAELRRGLEACASMGAWTEDLALAWWEVHGDAVRDLRGPEMAIPESRTIAIDLTDGRCC